jgi:hypothetical protein
MTLKGISPTSFFLICWCLKLVRVVISTFFNLIFNPPSIHFWWKSWNVFFNLFAPTPWILRKHMHCWWLKEYFQNNSYTRGLIKGKTWKKGENKILKKCLNIKHHCCRPILLNCYDISDIVTRLRAIVIQLGLHTCTRTCNSWSFMLWRFSDYKLFWVFFTLNCTNTLSCASG